MCAPHAGVCDCRDNTAGPHCERCGDGYYGDSTAGTSADCQPCPCPGGSSCAMVPKTKEVVCTNCPTGTTGESSGRTGVGVSPQPGSPGELGEAELESGASAQTQPLRESLE